MKRRCVIRCQLSDVQESNKGLKLNRAAGLDMVSTTMLKNASRSMVCLITKMFNEVLKTGVVPEDLQIGKMTLNDKKEPVIYGIYNYFI